MSYKQTTLIALLSSVSLCLGMAFPMFTVHAQRATPEPPTPTPIVIVIEESVSVGETSGNGGLGPITEAIAIEDSISAIDPINETIAIEDSTSAIDPINETIAIEDSTPVIHFLTETMAAEAQKAGQASREKRSRDAFSRATGSVQESGEGFDDGSLGEAGNAGSTRMTIVYVVIGLVAVGLLGLLGRRLLRVGSPS